MGELTYLSSVLSDTSAEAIGGPPVFHWLCGFLLAGTFIGPSCRPSMSCSHLDRQLKEHLLVQPEAPHTLCEGLLEQVGPRLSGIQTSFPKQLKVPH